MNKSEFFKTLTKEQKTFVEFLLDESYSKGYIEGKMDEHAVNYYERY